MDLVFQPMQHLPMDSITVNSSTPWPSLSSPLLLVSLSSSPLLFLGVSHFEVRLIHLNLSTSIFVVLLAVRLLVGT